VLTLNATMEVSLLLVIFVELFTAARSPLRLMLYVNVLRAKYNCNDDTVFRIKYTYYNTGFYHREVWKMFGDKLQPIRSMDYLLAKELREACRPTKHGGGPSPFLARLAAMAESGLGPGAVRFARNHYTALNGGPALCGIDWSNAEDAKLAWAYLLSAPEGSVLLYEEDAKVPIVQRALAFRRAVAHRATLHAALAADEEGTLEFEVSAGSTSFDPVMLLVRLRGAGGTTSSCAPLGVVLLSLEGRQRQRPRTPTRLRHKSRSPACRPTPVQALVQVPWDLGRGARLAEVLGGAKRADSSWSPRLGEAFRLEEGLRQPLDAAQFFLIEAPLAECDRTSKDLVLLYHTTWSSPHVHFGLQSRWTAAPGWPLRRASGLLEASKEEEEAASAEEGEWWTVHVPLVEGCGPVEFVINDGGGCWDHASCGGNYRIDGPGAFIVERGHLREFGHKL